MTVAMCTISSILWYMYIVLCFLFSLFTQKPFGVHAVSILLLYGWSSFHFPAAYNCKLPDMGKSLQLDALN